MFQELWGELKNSLADVNREPALRREYLSRVGEAEDAGVCLIGMWGYVEDYAHTFCFVIRKDGHFRYTEPRRIPKGRKGRDTAYQESGAIDGSTFHALAHFLQAIAFRGMPDRYENPDMDVIGGLQSFFRVLFDDGYEKEISVTWAAPSTIWVLEQALLKIIGEHLSGDALQMAEYAKMSSRR